MNKTFKRTLALLLAIIMIATILPTFALADETADEVIYNLGSREITVSNFDANGNYTIILEENAFFPYEVQFQANGRVEVKWFYTPESTVEFAGRTFRVYSAQTDDTTIQQIGVWVDDLYIPAFPEAKEFTNKPFEPYSLLPLQQFNVTLDLTALNRFQFSNISMSTILGGMQGTFPSIESGARVAWARAFNDDFEIVTQADSIDLSGIMNVWNTQFILDLIVGSVLQLDDTNIRYRVTITTANFDSPVQSIDVFTETEGVRSVATFADTRIDSWPTTHQGQFFVPRNASAQTYYVGITLRPEYSGSNVRAIQGNFNSAAAAIDAATVNPALDVTDDIMNQTLSNAQTGLSFAFNPPFTVGRNFTLVFDNAGHFNVHISIQEENNWVSFSTLRDSAGNWVSGSTSTQTVSGVRRTTSQLLAANPADAEYHLILNFLRNGANVNNPLDYITRAVLGNHTTEEAINAQPDISSQLFASQAAGNGYLGNFSGDGLYFSILAEGEIHRINVRTVDAPGAPTPGGAWNPNPGNADTFFRMQGALGVPASGVYVMPFAHDSYHAFGFQTVFLLDDTLDLSAITPTFWTANDVNVFSGEPPVRQESGVNVADFSQGAVQYAVPATDGIAARNYFVTFAQRYTDGPQLFVNGINGEDGATRRVFFNRTFNYQHDIFIANIGNAPLTGLNVTLDDGFSVFPLDGPTGPFPGGGGGGTGNAPFMIDAYWTVGGAGNDTLAAFDTTNPSQMGNIAKIRLIPVRDGDWMAEGAIEGTLTITADGIDPVVIELTGHAGNPRLTVEAIPEAVRYVPYATMLLHNNMYPWNTVTMSIVSGSLPEGVVLRPNGEIYGTPQEEGTFNFRVQMSNSDPNFGTSAANFTLIVHENTDENVDAQNDPGFGVIERIADFVVFSDQVIVFEGPLGDPDNFENDFIALWLNGVQLTRDVHYTAEDGSTRITVRAQTFTQHGTPGRNTIAGEFRNSNQELRTGAQNFNQGATAPRPPSGGGNNAVTQFTVTFVSGDENFMSSTRINRGDTLAGIATPTRSGMNFAGWYTDANFTQAFGMNTPITANITLFARWTIIMPEQPPENAIEFIDINADDWFFPYVDWAFSSELMLGINNAQWAPHLAATRAMTVTVLARLIDADTSVHANLSVPGIPEGRWYTPYAKWAYAEGLMLGNGAGFALEEEVSRQDLGVFLVRFLEYLDVNVDSTANNAPFADAEQIAYYAVEALQILQNIGIFRGTGNNMVEPQRQTSRAELAALLYRIDRFIAESSN